MAHGEHNRDYLFPMLMNLAGRRVVVIGGGVIAERKVHSLLECGASVTVISPRLKGGLPGLAAQARVTHIARTYEPGDLRGAALAVVAIDDREAGRSIAGDARSAGIPVNVVDRPELCTFTVPAVLRRGHLTLAVATDGTSPAWARHIKRRLGEEYGGEFTRLFDALASIRQTIMRDIADPGRRRELLMRLADDSILDMARTLPADRLEPALRQMTEQWVKEDKRGDA